MAATGSSQNALARVRARLRNKLRARTTLRGAVKDEAGLLSLSLAAPGKALDNPRRRRPDGTTRERDTRG